MESRDAVGGHTAASLMERTTTAGVAQQNERARVTVAAYPAPDDVRFILMEKFR